MKKLFALPLVLVLTASFGYPAKINVSFAGGLARIDAGELVTGLQGQSDFIAKQFGATGGYSMPTTGLFYNQEISYFPFRHFGIGVGYGFFRMDKQTSAAYNVGQVAITESVTPDITVKPLTVNLHGLIFLSSWLHLDISAGVGSYATTVKWSDANTSTLGTFSGSEQYTFQAKQNLLGYQGGLALEILISPQFTFVLGATGRYVRTNPLTSAAWTDQGKDMYGPFSASGNDHSLWAYTWTADGVKYAQLAFQASAPSGSPSIGDIRTPRINLSGLAATIGLKIVFDI